MKNKPFEANKTELLWQDNLIPHIGKIAFDLLHALPDIWVQGVTSRGVFLRLSSGWVIFLSLERYRGPLTMNIQGEAEILQAFEHGAPVQVRAGFIEFPGSGWRVYFDGAETWQAPPLPETALPLEGCTDRLARTVRELKRLQKDSMFADLLPDLAGGPGSENDPGGLHAMLADMQNALTEGDLEGFMRGASKALGLGAGLTPAGDDLLAGLVLALNRWQHVLAADLDLETFNRELTSLAYDKTTRLSANLVECACRGQADERLILALDGILAGSYEPEQCASALAGWGRTSGVDALAGMALGVNLK